MQGQEVDLRRSYKQICSTRVCVGSSVKRAVPLGYTVTLVPALVFLLLYMSTGVVDIL